MRAALISIPKSGTNLVIQLLHAACPQAPMVDLMYPEPYIPGMSKRSYGMSGFIHSRRQFQDLKGDVLCHGHIVFNHYLLVSLIELDVRPVFLYRDPRAVIVSFVHHVLKTESHPVHHYFRHVLPDMEARLEATILGIDEKTPGAPFLPALTGAWRRFGAWMHQPEVLKLRYENLVGEEFGGRNDKQHRTVARLLAHVGVEADEARVAEVIRRGADPGVSQTFRRGGVDAWREFFTPRIHELFTRQCGSILRRFHYDP